MRGRWLLVWCAASALGACQCGEPREEVRAPEEVLADPGPRSPEAEQETSTPMLARSSTATRTPTDEERAALRARRRTFTLALRRARTAAREERLSDALAAMDEALAALPDPRARCEAGYLAFRAGDSARARASIEEALRGLPRDEDVPESLRVPLAMCLYNAGLVRRAVGDGPGARDALARSIALRPHPSAQRALDEIGAPEASSEGAAELDPPRLSAAALDALLTDAHRPFRDTLQERACEELDELPPVQTRGDVHAMILEPCRAPTGTGELWITHDGTVDVIELYELERPDAEVGASRWGTAHASWLDLVPGGRAELVVGVQTSDGFYLPGDEGDESSATTETSVLVCELAERLRCMGARAHARTESVSLDARVEDEERAVEGETRDDVISASITVEEGGWVEVGAPHCRSMRARGALEDAFDHDVDAILSEVACEPDASPLPPGRYPLSELLRDPRVCTVGCEEPGVPSAPQPPLRDVACRSVPEPAGVPGGVVVPEGEWFDGTLCLEAMSCPPLVYQRGDEHWLAMPYEIQRASESEPWIALCSLGPALGPEPLPALDRLALDEAARAEPAGRAPIVAWWLETELEADRLHAEQRARTRMLVIVDAARGVLERVLESYEEGGPYCWRGECASGDPRFQRVIQTLSEDAERAAEQGERDLGWDDGGRGESSYSARREVSASVDQDVLMVSIGPWTTVHEASLEDARSRDDHLDVAPLGVLAQPGAGERTYR